MARIGYLVFLMVFVLPFHAWGLSVTTYGALCNGVFDDAKAFTTANAVAVALGGATIDVPPGCSLGSTVKVSAKVVFNGTGQSLPSVKALSANLTLFNLGGAGAAVTNLMIDQSAFTNASGCAINIGGGEFGYVNQVTILGSFEGVCSSGTAVTIQNTIVLNPTTTTGTCFVINVSFNTYLLNNLCRGTSSTLQPYAAVKIVGAGGGHVLYNMQGIWSGNGLVVNANGVTIEWIFSVNTVMDTGTGTGLLLTANGAGVLKGFQSTGDWASSFDQNGISVTQGTGTIDQVSFTGLRAFANKQNGVAFNSGTNLSVNASSICGNSTAPTNTHNGILADAGATGVKITDSTIGTCALVGGGTPTQAWGVLSLSPSIQIQGNTLNGNVGGPVSLAAAPTTAIIKDNIGIDNVVPTIASATTITLPVNPTVVLSGVASVQTINGFWPGRQVLIVPQSTANYITGGNISVANTPTPGQPSIAVYFGSSWSVR
ncbi:MAG: hypothetical protein PSV46_01155 [Reyranella sp.]|nr:hypothetical protein [Reyranella sp.]